MKASIGKLVALLLVAVVYGALAEDLETKCGSDEGCVDRELVGIIEKFDKEESVPLFGGLEIVKTSEDSPVTVQGGEDLMERIRRFVDNHELKYREEDGSSARGFDAEARGKMKKLMMPLLLALKLKMIIVMSVVLTAVKLIAIKGVFAGLTALFLSGLTALKSFAETKHEPVTAILATPLHSLHHHDMKWGRQDVEMQQQAAAAAAAIDPYQMPYAGYQHLNQ